MLPRRPRGSLPIAVISGIEIEVHWTFAFLVAFIVVATAPGGPHAVATGLLWIAAVFGSIVIHELSHSFVARRRGAVVLGILLLPIGGMSRLQRVPDSPRDELAIAVIGPASSFVLSGLLVAVGAIAGAHLWPPTLTTGSWSMRIAWLNVLLGAFNLLPAIPMDGGRILRATLALHHSRIWATRRAADVARVIAFGMLVVGILYDVWLVFIAIFVLVGAGAESADADERDRRRERMP